MGRCKYETNVLPRLEEIKAWARNGLSIEQMAQNCHVAVSTFKDYLNRFPDLSTAVRENREYVDNVLVVNAYLKRVLGYDVDEETREYIYDADGTEHLVKRKVAKRHIPGDARAAEFWLTRRRGKDWPMTVNVQQAEGEDGGVILIPAVMESQDGDLAPTT